MTGPRLGQGMPVDDSWITRKFADLERQIRELSAARTLDASTISPDGTLTVDGTLDVTGDLKVSGTTNLDGAVTAGGTIQSDDYVAGTSGFKLDGSTDNAEFNSLTLRSGIIGDDDLANPTRPATVNDTSSGSTFTGSYAAYLTHAVSVPAGFTSAQVIAVAVITASTSGSLAVQAKITVNGHDSLDVTSASATLVTDVVPYAVALTGLSGTFNISVSAEIAGTMLSGTGSVYLSAQITFLR